VSDLAPCLRSLYNEKEKAHKKEGEDEDLLLLQDDIFLCAYEGRYVKNGAVMREFAARLYLAIGYVFTFTI
jgi:hypothetical protein